MAIELFFDRVKDEAHGLTNNEEKILYNLRQVSEKFFEQYRNMLLETGQVIIFAPTGRYISVITACLEDNKRLMMTFDLQNDKMAAKYFANRSEGNPKQFMAAFRQIRYKKNYDQFKLVRGEIPTRIAVPK